MGKVYLHQSILEILLRRIKTGVYEPGGKIPKTKELARELDTSSVTIDKALSSLVEQGYLTRKAKKGSFISPKAVWPENEGEKESSASFYSLLMRDSPLPYFWKNTIKGIHDAVREHDSDILSSYIDDDLAAALDCVAGLHRKGVRGIVFAPLSMPTEREYEDFNAAVIDLIRKCGIPFVLVDRFLETRDASHVVSRDYEAAVKLTEQLFAAGVEKPLCLTHLHNSPFAARIRGFRDVLKARGFEEADIGRRVVDIAPGAINFDPKDAEALAPLFRTLPDFDGVFAVNAVNLYACVNALSYTGDRRADNVRYVNFDDIGLLCISGLLMSAVQESHRIGRLAGEMLVGMIPGWPDSTFHVVKDYCYKTFNR